MKAKNTKEILKQIKECTGTFELKYDPLENEFICTQNDDEFWHWLVEDGNKDQYFRALYVGLYEPGEYKWNEELLEKKLNTVFNSMIFAMIQAKREEK